MTGVHKKKHEDCWLPQWVLITAIIILAIFCWVTRDTSPSSEVAPAVHQVGATLYIPTVFELQQALCDAGYKVEVDGVIGLNKRETLDAWDSFCADRMAAKYMTKTGAPK